MKIVSVWSQSRSRLFLPEAGEDPSRSEPESAPGPLPAGAAQKIGGSVTLKGSPTRYILSMFLGRVLEMEVTLSTLTH